MIVAWLDWFTTPAGKAIGAVTTFAFGTAWEVGKWAVRRFVHRR